MQAMRSEVLSNQPSQDRGFCVLLYSCTKMPRHLLSHRHRPSPVGSTGDNRRAHSDRGRCRSSAKNSFTWPSVEAANSFTAVALCLRCPSTITPAGPRVLLTSAAERALRKHSELAQQPLHADYRECHAELAAVGLADHLPGPQRELELHPQRILARGQRIQPRQLGARPVSAGGRVGFPRGISPDRHRTSCGSARAGRPYLRDARLPRLFLYAIRSVNVRVSMLAWINGIISLRSSELS